LASTPAGLGADIRRVERPSGGGFALEPDAIRSVVDDTTAMVVVSNRHNPSGHLADRATLERLGAAAGAHGARLLVDEVYAPYLPEPRKGPGTAFGGPTAAGLEGTVVTNSLTKFFGFGGLRIGWLLADEAFVEAARSVSAHLPDVAGPSRALARRAFNNLDRIVARSRKRVAANSSRLAAFVEERPDLHGPLADGSTFGFPGHESADGDAVTAAAGEAGILVVPGRFFGDPSRFRLSLSDSPAAMDAALDGFGGVLDGLADR
jgi:aspartate/methionine/tyrosine aminotransferase